MESLGRRHCRRNRVVTIAYAELPVETPKTTAALLAQERRGDIYWAAFRLGRSRSSPVAI
jgi:hypothetical protein